MRNSVVVKISDTGKGIPQDQIGKIFDAFFTTKGPGEGTGLGLSIAYRILQDHNATISVDSEVGKGTTFRIAFPMKAAEKERTLKMLIVDDDADIRQVLSSVVSLLYPTSVVRTAENGFEARDLLDSFKPDIVLLDMNMPGMNGLEVCGKIKRTPKYRRTKVVLISGTLEYDDLKEGAKAVGVDQFLKKPITQDILKQTIQNLLGENPV